MVTGLPYGTAGRIQTQILKGLLFAPSFAAPAKDGKYLGTLSLRNTQEKRRALEDDSRTLGPLSVPAQRS
jgi:hypothetical protein